MLDMLFRFSFNQGMCGGIVVAPSKEDAQEKAERYLEAYMGNDYNGSEVLVWGIKEDIFYDERYPYIVNCYGE